MVAGSRGRHEAEEHLLSEEVGAYLDESEQERLLGPAVIHHRTPHEDIPVGLHHLISVLVGCLCMLCAGSLYAYGAYSDQLKGRLGWTESDMEVVGYLGDCGSYLTGLITGALQDAYGPRWSALGAASLLSIGFAGMAFGLATRAYTSPEAYGFLLFLTGAGSGWIYTAVLCTNIEMFPGSYRGKLVGVLVSQNGLSALVFTLIYENTFSGTDTAGFLWCAAAVCGAVCILGSVAMPWLLKATKNSRWDKSAASDSSSCGQYPLSCICRRVQSPPLSLSLSLCLSLCLSPPPLPPSIHLNLAFGLASSLFPLIRSARQEHVSVRTSVRMALTSRAFWLLGAVSFLLTGNGLMVINNIGSLATAADSASGRALRGPLVEVLSLCNCSGRLISGFLSDLLPVRRGVFFAAASVVFAAAFLHALVLKSLMSLWVLVVSVGVAYGAVWSIMLSTISEVFGEEHFGLNSGLVVMLFSATGGLAFNTIAGAAYDAKGDGQGHCTAGWVCFETPLAVGLVCSLVAGVLSLFLVPMTPVGRR